MSLILFYDTETTGLPDFKAPSESEHQPHLVQVAALLTTGTGKVISSIDLTVSADAWEIPTEVAEIHGITTERSREIGVSESVAVAAFYSLWSRASKRVAHNEQFDARIMRIALLRHMSEAAADFFKAGAAECTARMCTPILNLPPTDKMKAKGMHFPKTPNLGEAYRHFFGIDLADAHTALADAQACAAVYWALKNLDDVVVDAEMES